METIISTVVALCMFVAGELQEHRIQVDPDTGKPSMATCLKGKREAERNSSKSIEWKCGKVQAELEENIDGSKSIKKIVSKQ